MGFALEVISKNWSLVNSLTTRFKQKPVLNCVRKGSLRNVYSLWKKNLQLKQTSELLWWMRSLSRSTYMGHCSFIDMLERGYSVEEHSCLCSTIYGLWNRQAVFFFPAKSQDHVTNRTYYTHITKTRVVKEIVFRATIKKYAIIQLHTSLRRTHNRKVFFFPSGTIQQIYKSKRQKHQHEVSPLIRLTSEHRQETLFVLVVQIKNWGGVSENVIL